MKITVKNLVISQTEWEERKNIRDFFLIIYEFFNTYDQLQKEFVILFKKLKNESTLNSGNFKFKKGIH